MTYNRGSAVLLRGFFVGLMAGLMAGLIENPIVSRSTL